MMPPLHILQVFDSVAFDCPDYPDQPGMVKCCGLPVVMRGGNVVLCLTCHRTISEVNGRWTVTDWEAKGIKISGWGLLEAEQTARRKLQALCVALHTPTEPV